jgi:hypothetical protein
MVERNFHSVPVLQQTENKYYGFLTLGDIVREVVRRFNKEHLRGVALLGPRHSLQSDPRRSQILLGPHGCQQSLWRGTQ